MKVPVVREMKKVIGKKWHKFDLYIYYYDDVRVLDVTVKRVSDIATVTFDATQLSELSKERFAHTMQAIYLFAIDDGAHSKRIVLDHDIDKRPDAEDFYEGDEDYLSIVL